MWVDTGYELVNRLRRVYSARAMRPHWRAGNHTWFDHRLDELDWPERIFWVERGVLGRFHLPQGGRVLDLFCGDGYFSDHFWASSAGHIDAVDRDSAALTLARACHSKPNIDYRCLDIVLDSLPGTGYDLVCFFEAIEHLSVENGLLVLEKVKDALVPGGWLVGSSTAVAAANRGRGNREHDNEFTDEQSLAAFVGQVFAEPTVFSTHDPARTTLSFVAQKLARTA
jgi:2-polyprenyl-3-methyl-5-hydroxy-6-metoxy-1,4-benzoquinol methylase